MECLSTTSMLLPAYGVFILYAVFILEIPGVYW